MDIKDVMIGDLVYLVDETASGIHKSVMRIASYREGKIVSKFVDVPVGTVIADYDMYEPIPITKQTMDKNYPLNEEYTYNCLGNCYHLQGNNYCVESSNNEWLYCCEYNGEETDEPILMGIAIIKSVHELLHIMKIRGLRELADNFKV